MDGVSFDVIGNRVILDNLDGLEATVQARVQSAMESASEVGKQYLEDHTPVGSREYARDGEEHPGYLKSQNSVEVRDGQIVLSNDASYAPFVELGTHKMAAEPWLVPGAIATGEALKQNLEGIV